MACWWQPCVAESRREAASLFCQTGMNVDLVEMGVFSWINAIPATLYIDHDVTSNQPQFTRDARRKKKGVDTLSLTIRRKAVSGKPVSCNLHKMAIPNIPFAIHNISPRRRTLVGFSKYENVHLSKSRIARLARRGRRKSSALHYFKVLQPFALTLWHVNFEQTSYSYYSEQRGPCSLMR